MSALLTVFIFTLCAGLAMPLGAILAKFERLRSDWLEHELRHSILAFGAGALLAAVALILVPDGLQQLGSLWAVFWFIAGALCFMRLDIALNRSDTPASMLAAMLADFIPESIALGAAFASGKDTAYLLALLIALQNVPEGFNAYRELKGGKRKHPYNLVAVFTVLSLFGPLAGIGGYLWLGQQPMLIGGIMLFASGGILYSIFQDIAPQVKLEKHYAPPLGAILGFMLGMVGFMYTH